MQVIKPPYPLKKKPSIFLAGSIEMGKAIDWQTDVEDRYAMSYVDIYNPRRDDWNSSWEQKIENAQFKEQVSWELNALEKADIILMNFVEGTMSPISLLEFGLYARSGKMVVVCPDGFWRKGNVDVVCQRYDIPNFKTMSEAIKHIDERVETYLT